MNTTLTLALCPDPAPRPNIQVHVQYSDPAHRSGAPLTACSLLNYAWSQSWRRSGAAHKGHLKHHEWHGAEL
eukprot:26396-Chlamydomonas_euryale.AAC.1